MSKRIKIFFIITHLHGGGAERVMSIILNHLDKKKFFPTLILLKKEGIFLSHLPQDLEIIDLKVDRVRYSVFKIIKLAWKKKPDIIFLNMFHLSIWTMMFKFLMPRKIKFISRES